MSVFVLKIIAAATMVVDHFGAAVYLHFMEGLPHELAAYEAMRLVGRIAFPIYAYLIAQGCVHTKNIGRYLLRLGFLALVSEVFFDLAFMEQRSGINFVRDTNIFYTLFFAVAAIGLYEKAKQKAKNIGGYGQFFLAVLAAVPAMIGPVVLTSDYGFLGVFLIFLIYIMDAENRTARAVAMTAGLCLIYFPATASGRINIYFAFAMIAVACVFFYNGKPGPRHAAVKWGFYAFYPVHIAVLVGLRFFL